MAQQSVSGTKKIKFMMTNEQIMIGIDLENSLGKLVHLRSGNGNVMFSIFGKLEVQDDWFSVKDICFNLDAIKKLDHLGSVLEIWL